MFLHGPVLSGTTVCYTAQWPVSGGYSLSCPVPGGCSLSCPVSGVTGIFRVCLCVAGRTSLTSHSQQLSLDLGMLGRPEGGGGGGGGVGGGGGGGEPTPLRSPDVSVTTLASLRQLVRREVELLNRQPPPPPLLVPPQPPTAGAEPVPAAAAAAAGSPASPSETSPEARSLQELSEHICQWQEAVGGAAAAPAPPCPPRRPPARRRALLAAQSLDQAASDQRLRRQLSVDHHEPPRPG